MAATVIPICWVEAAGARVTGVRAGDVGGDLVELVAVKARSRAGPPRACRVIERAQQPLE